MKANIMDQMYYGQSPANFGQISHYDAARGECYRDFGDCIGISSRTLLQGLFGIIPQALDGKCIIRPGFPAKWESASVKTPYLSYKYTCKNGKVRVEITQNFRQPLQIIFRQNLGGGAFKDVVGSTAKTQVLEYDVDLNPVKLAKYYNANVTDIFKNKYVSPRPQTTTLQIPVQGIGEWCHPKKTAEINDSVFRTKIVNGVFNMAGIPFSTPQKGQNIIYTSLWDNYPDAVTIPLKGKAQKAYLLMAGSTNHMQSRIDNGLVVVAYTDGTTDTLALRNPDNWCPIEQDYYIDGMAFNASQPRPYRVCFSTGDVSRNLGSIIQLGGDYGRDIPGGAGQMLEMPLNAQKRLKSLTIRTLSNDVVIGLMAVTLQP
jgi:hypothetical protein